MTQFFVIYRDMAKLGPLGVIMTAGSIPVLLAFGFGWFAVKGISAVIKM